MCVEKEKGACNISEEIRPPTSGERASPDAVFRNQRGGDNLSQQQKGIDDISKQKGEGGSTILIVAKRESEETFRGRKKKGCLLFPKTRGEVVFEGIRGDLEGGGKRYHLINATGGKKTVV